LLDGVCVAVTDHELSLSVARDEFFHVTRRAKPFEVEAVVGAVAQQFNSNGYQITEKFKLPFLGRESEVVVAYRSPYTTVKVIATRGRCLYEFEMSQVQLEPNYLIAELKRFHAFEDGDQWCE
jgi:hypothetical protein